MGEIVKALILAAGEGTRLRPLTLDRPKPMLPIDGRPLLERLVNWLQEHGITNIAINLHYKPKAVTDHFCDGHEFGVNIIYSYEEELLGSAGAVKKLQTFFDEPFVVVYGDLYTNLNLKRLIDFHNSRKKEVTTPAFLTMSLYRVDNPTECGLVTLDERKRVTHFVEKPSQMEVFTNVANAGVLVIEPGILDYIPTDTAYDFGHDVFHRLFMANIPMFGLIITPEEYLIDIGTPQGYARAQWWAEEQKC